MLLQNREQSKLKEATQNFLTPERIKKFNPAEYSEKKRGSVQEAFYELRNEYPECIDITFFGSLVKGYDTLESDIDLYVYVDFSRSADQEIQALDSKNPGIIWMDRHYKKHTARILERLKDILLKKGVEIALDKPRDDQSIFCYAISNKMLEKRINDMQKLTAQTDEDKGIRATEYFSHLFCISVGDLNERGSTLNEYRKKAIHILQNLEQKGKGGAKIWQWIMQNVNTLETYTKRPLTNGIREHFTPQNLTQISLDKAEEFFGK